MLDASNADSGCLHDCCVRAARSSARPVHSQGSVRQLNPQLLRYEALTRLHTTAVHVADELLRCVVRVLRDSVMRLPCPSFRPSSRLCWRAAPSASDGSEQWEADRAAAVGIPSVMGSATHLPRRHAE